VGVSQFADPGIRDLRIAHKDAQSMVDVMRKCGGVDDARVLVNEEATLANVREATCKWLPQCTRPGDVVLIYWSGHGARCADDNGDEKDGYDEYLVPHDGSLDDLGKKRNTMLLDDTFGRWMQDLDGRRLLVILDTCHSGGQHSREKGLAGPTAPLAGTEFDYFDGEFARTKDIGQRDTAMLASSKASQVSFERREGDLSVMTHCLVSLLQTASGRLSLQEAYNHLKRDVPLYVQQRFPGTTQTPVLIDNTSSPLFLRP
jgi:uncharacterized caspase-like protein